MGGGSSINVQSANRGLPRDYDEWRDLGARGWGWADVLPYFLKLETDLDFDGPLHGKHGPIPIRRIAREAMPPFGHAVGEGVVGDRPAVPKGPERRVRGRHLSAGLLQPQRPARLDRSRISRRSNARAAEPDRLGGQRGRATPARWPPRDGRRGRAGRAEARPSPPAA